jgi:hypothetical protein
MPERSFLTQHADQIVDCSAVDPSRHILERIIKESDLVACTPEIAVGVLVASDEGHLLVRLNNVSDLRSFTVAASCLLRPKSGDLVSCLCMGTGIWVQHILSRAGEVVEAPFSIDDGCVSIDARSIHMTAETDIKLNAELLQQRTKTTREQCNERFSDVAGMRMESSKNLMVRVAKHANIKADSLTQVAVSLMKLDGSQIHMG